MSAAITNAPADRGQLAVSGRNYHDHRAGQRETGNASPLRTYLVKIHATGAPGQPVRAALPRSKQTGIAGSGGQRLTLYLRPLWPAGCGSVRRPERDAGSPQSALAGGVSRRESIRAAYKVSTPIFMPSSGDLHQEIATGYKAKRIDSLLHAHAYVQAEACEREDPGPYPSRLPN